MSVEDIEASKAPLMDHLIELRARLIKALIGFGVAFVFCFFFAKQIYNILVWPFVWVAGPENSKFIYTALLEYFFTQLKIAMFGAAFLAVSANHPLAATVAAKDANARTACAANARRLRCPRGGRSDLNEGS